MSKENIILDRSGPRMKTAATAIDYQWGGSGNYATIGIQRRKRGGGQVKRRKEKKKKHSKEMIRIGTLNVGSMTGRSREIVDLMQRRKVNVLCTQKTRWKGAKAREVGEGYKLYYYYYYYYNRLF